jgi:hypothetical protein
MFFDAMLKLRYELYQLHTDLLVELGGTFDGLNSDMIS